MSKKIIVILLLIPFISPSQVVSDAKMWAGITVNKKINDFEFSFTEELRMDENISHIDKIFTELGAQYKIRKGLFVAFNYRFDRDNDYESYGYDINHRIDFGVTYKRKFDKWRLAFRTKYQKKSAPSDKNNPTFWRNKFTVNYSLENDITPYLAYEFYYQFNNQNVINRQRYQLGGKYKLTDKTAIKVFYMLEKRRNVKNLKNNHIWGVGYSIDL